MNEIKIIAITEVIGTIAFSVSGSLIAIRRYLDLFGVIFVGCITSVGGGILRDIFLGKNPPSVFSNPLTLSVAAITSITVFIICYLNAQKFELLKERIEYVNNLFDAIGLAAFSITGVEIIFNSDFRNNALFAISMGLLTGVGGGIIRDILVDKTPLVLKKHIYALASILGSTFYYFINKMGAKIIAIVISMSIIVVIRILAAKHRWELPKILFNTQNKKEITK